MGWYYNNSESKTHPVAQKAHNGYGLYDMSGNVIEWLWDPYPGYSESRFTRGGSWGCGDFRCELDRKYGENAYDADRYLGFRIVRSTGK